MEEFIMLDRKELNARADKLRNDKGYTGSNTDVFYLNICAAVTEFEKYMDGAERSDDDIMVAKRPVNRAIIEYNDEQRMLRLEQLRDMPPKAAMLSFIDDQTVAGLTFSKNKDDVLTLGKTKSVVDSYEFYAIRCGKELDNILDLVCIWADNLARWHVGSDGAYISRNSAHKNYIEMRKDKKMDTDLEKLSKSELAKQLNKICSSISFGVTPKMINADVTYLQTAIMQGVDKANAAGKIVLRNEDTILRFVFRAMYTRHKGLAYDFQNKTNARNAPRTFRANGDMSESGKAEEFKKDATPEAGPVTMGTPEK